MSWLALEGKTAVVTGGASGIGKAVVQAFLDNGANVVVCDMNPQTPEYDLHEGSGEFLYVPTDVTKADSVKAMVEAGKAKFGKLDILVNNAGITRDGLIMKMSEADYDAVLDTNLKGAFNTIRHMSRYFLKQKSGRIINISSVSGILGNAGQANYSASKAGVIGLTKAVARELASRGITANAVAPGFVETEMTDVLADAAKENLLSQIPLGRPGNTKDIANAVLFLASDAAGYITGQVLSVDGGMAI